MGYKLKPINYVKYKALKLVLPETANAYGIEAEAPVFISPYIHTRGRCDTCRVEYTPLLYQVGHETVAQHFCKTNGGGIYVRLATDRSGKWIYTNDLWHAIVHPTGPIRMGDDRGFQFRSVNLTKMMPPKCWRCGSNSLEPTLMQDTACSGTLLDNSGSLVPMCDKCTDFFEGHTQNWSPAPATQWTWHYDGTEIRFRNAITPSYEDFLKNTSRVRADVDAR